MQYSNILEKDNQMSFPINKFNKQIIFVLVDRHKLFSFKKANKY